MFSFLLNFFLSCRSISFFYFGIFLCTAVSYILSCVFSGQAMVAADQWFMKEAEASTRAGSSWEFAAVRNSLQVCGIAVPIPPSAHPHVYLTRSYYSLTFCVSEINPISSVADALVYTPTYTWYLRNQPTLLAVFVAKTKPQSCHGLNPPQAFTITSICLRVGLVENAAVPCDRGGIGV